MKIILGSAQFGMPYGITNQSKKILEDHELFEALDCAWKRGIRCIDSAQFYGNALKRIESYHAISKNKFDIINKILRYPLSDQEDFNALKKELKAQLLSLDISSFDTIMIHHISGVPDFFSQENFQSLVDDGIAKKIGLSIGCESEYRHLEKRFSFDVVQLPFNILNQQYITMDFLKELYDKKIEIHARSIFLQGILAANAIVLPDHLKGLDFYLKKIIKIANENNTSLKSLALHFAINIPYIKKIVLGVQSVLELEEILNIYDREEKKNYGQEINWFEFSCPQFDLIDPTRW